MKLMKLVIKNFRSYENANISFSTGQNYIFGRNWQGKTSVMDAIGYAFFGKRVFPTRLAGASVKTEHLVHEGSKDGFVQLCFEHDGKDYILTRTCPRDSPTLVCEGKVLGQTVTTVKEALHELLGIDEDLFVNVFYSEQDELRKVLEIKPENRKVFIESILGFEYLKGVKMFAKHASDSLGNWIEGFTSGNVKTMMEMSKNLEARVEEINTRLKELNSQIVKFKKFKDVDKKIQGAYRKAVEATQKVNKAISEEASLSTEKTFVQSLSDGVSTGTCPICEQTIPAIKQPKLLGELKSRIESIDIKIEQAKKELGKFNEELGKANRDYENYHLEAQDLSNLTGERDAVTNELNEHNKNLKGMKRDLVAYENKNIVFKRVNEERQFLDELQIAIDEFRDALRKCMTADLENSVNYFMSRFGDGDFDARLKINEEFGFEIFLHGRPVPVFNLSGAARDILALSIRYGLYRIASKEINFILLDEPTHHLDPMNIDKMKDAFNELVEQQLIIITVHDEFSDAVGKKFVVEKDNQFVSLIREIA